MTEVIWDKRIVPVILLPGGERGDRILDLAESWTQSWLLSPAIWIRVEDVRDESGDPATHTQGHPPRVTGHVVGRNGRRTVDLFHELGRVEVETLRLVVTRWVEEEQSPGDITHDEWQDRVVDILGAYVKRSQPVRRELDDGTKVGTKLIRINLVFAPTERGGGSFAHLLESSWTANVVVAPEDRPTPASFDAFTRERDDEAMNGFILANAATAAGLWPGLNDSVYELTAFDGSELQGLPEGAALVQRTFVRGVLSDGLAFRTARRALTDSVAATSPLLDPAILNDLNGLEVFSPAEAEEAVQRMLDLSMRIDGGRLAYQRRMMSPYRRGRVGLIRALGRFLRFSWDKLRCIPGWAFDSVTQRASRRATAALHGEEGMAEIDSSLDFGTSRSRVDQQLMERARLLEVRKESLRQLSATPLPLGRRENTPRLWADMRQLIFSVLDGSDAPNLAGSVQRVDMTTVDDAGVLGSRSVWARMIAPFRRKPAVAESQQPLMVIPQDALEAQPLVLVSAKGYPRVIGDVGIVVSDPRDQIAPPPGLQMTGRAAPGDDLSVGEASHATRVLEAIERRTTLVTQRLGLQSESIATLQWNLAACEERVEFAISALDEARWEAEQCGEELTVLGIEPAADDEFDFDADATEEETVDELDEGDVEEVGDEAEENIDDDEELDDEELDDEELDDAVDDDVAAGDVETADSPEQSDSLDADSTADEMTPSSVDTSGGPPRSDAIFPSEPVSIVSTPAEKP